MALHRGVVAGLLCTSESRELRRQVETLRQSRSAVLDVEASELHRIERDLHDGAQQRLVMLTIDLGLASERIDTDPAAAKQLILDGQEQARQALAEIRAARPRDRAVDPARPRARAGARVDLRSWAGADGRSRATSPRASGCRRRSSGRPTSSSTEALANVAKHSGATRCEVRFRREEARLVVEVWDDGAGGASVEPGGGLAGLAGRVAGVDGAFSVASPAGGPTLVRAEIPLAGAGADGAAPAPRNRGRPGPPGRGGGRPASRAARACRRCC